MRNGMVTAEADQWVPAVQRMAHLLFDEIPRIASMKPRGDTLPILTGLHMLLGEVAGGRETDRPERR